MGNNSRSRFWTFHNATTTTGNGFEMLIGSDDVKMNVEIKGTATSATLIFELCPNDDGVYYAVCQFNATTKEFVNTTTSIGSLWNFDLEGYVKVRVRISAISGGNITVKGTVVN